MSILFAMLVSMAMGGDVVDHPRMRPVIAAVVVDTEKLPAAPGDGTWTIDRWTVESLKVSAKEKDISFLLFSVQKTDENPYLRIVYIGLMVPEKSPELSLILKKLSDIPFVVGVLAS